MVHLYNASLLSNYEIATPVHYLFIYRGYAGGIRPFPIIIDDFQPF